MMSGLDSDTASAPGEDVWRNRSATAFQVVPPSVVFHTPPPAAPK
jgi:hypothetical protein